MDGCGIDRKERGGSKRTEGFGGGSNEALDVDTGTHHDEDIELVGLTERDKIGDKGGYFDQRLVTTVNLVEEPLRGDTWHRLLACRIDGQEDGAVGDGERRGKAIDQVVGATV